MFPAVQRSKKWRSLSLLKVMIEPSVPASVRVRPADSVLNHAAKAIEIEDIEARDRPWYTLGEWAKPFHLRKALLRIRATQGPVIPNIQIFTPARREMMQYPVSRNELRNLLQWLREGREESSWEDQIRLLSETIANLQDLAHPTANPEPTNRRSAESDSFSPYATAINVAVPQLMKMLDAMKAHDRTPALEYGEAAVGLLPED